MTLPASGPISLSQIAAELGISTSGGFSFDANEAALRLLAGVPSGPVKFSDFYGKSAFTVAIASQETSAVDTATHDFTVAPIITGSVTPTKYELGIVGTVNMAPGYPQFIVNNTLASPVIRLSPASQDTPCNATVLLTVYTAGGSKTSPSAVLTYTDLSA